jgi:hypothetical protein
MVTLCATSFIVQQLIIIFIYFWLSQANLLIFLKYSFR